MAAKLKARSWEFEPPADAEPITQTRYGRTVTVEPVTLEVSRRRWGLHVVVEGRSILKNGSYGRHRRAAMWNDADLHEAPEWVRLAVAEAS